MILDDWQKEVLECREKRILICKGRQIGGTTIFAKKAADRLASKPKEEIMVTSITEEQAQHVIMMVLQFLEKEHKSLLSKKKQDTTKGKILLKNGSTIISKAVGTTGASVRGFTKGVLWLNEGSRLPEFVFEAAKPMLLTTDGEIWMDSTPFGKKGYFWESFQNKSGIWKVFYKNTEEVIKERKISPDWTEKQREGALRLLKEEKDEMTELQYGQEYLGLFLEELRRLFSDEIIAKVCCIKRDYPAIIRGRCYLGVDVAGMGEDKNSFEVVDKFEEEKIRQIESITTKKEYTHQTSDRILDLDKKFQFRRIGVDDGGVGFGLFSNLLNSSQTKKRVEALNNSRRFIDNDKKAKKRILKEDMYFNLLNLMEKGKIKLLDDIDVRLSLASVQIEENEDRVFIFGKDTHIAEGLIRACWLAVQDRKSLNLRISYI